jgi:hypothetical protein
MSDIQEGALTEEQREELLRQTEIGLETLGFHGESDPLTLVYAVSRFVENWRVQRNQAGQYSRLLQSGPDRDATALCLGAVWGAQVGRVTDWEWVCAHNYYYAMVSPDRAYFVFPTFFIRNLLIKAMAIILTLTISMKQKKYWSTNLEAHFLQSPRM